jgi:hypothetical protein
MAHLKHRELTVESENFLKSLGFVPIPSCSEGHSVWTTTGILNHLYIPLNRPPLKLHDIWNIAYSQGYEFGISVGKQQVAERLSEKILSLTQ